MKHPMKTLAVSVAVALASCSLQATDARDGLVAWWVSVGDLNGNGVLDASEMVDLVNYTTAEGPSTAESVNQMTEDGANPWEKARPILHDTFNGKWPMGQVQANDEPIIQLQNPTNFTDTGAVVASLQTITLPCDNLELGDEMTFIVTGVKPCRRLGTNAGGSWDVTHVLCYDYSHSANTGIALGFGAQGSANWGYDSCKLGWTTMNMSTGLGGPANPGASDGYLYDIGASIQCNVPEKGKATITIFARRNDNDKTSYDGNALKTETQVYNTTFGWSNADPKKRKLVIGNTADTTTSSFVGDAAMLARQYYGPVRFVKVYNRVLTPEEFDEACLAKEDPLWSIGTRNATANEFSDALAETTFDADTMPWRKFRKTLDEAHPSVSIRCNLDAADRDIPRVLQVKALGADGFTSCDLDVAVNGRSVGRMSVMAGEESLFFLKKWVMQTVTEVGGKYPMTVTLTRVGNLRGTLSFDWLALQGGWQAGLDNNSYGDFATWGNPWSPGAAMYNFRTYYIGQRDFKTLCGQMQKSANDLPRWFRFELTDEMAAKCGFEWKLKMTDGDAYYNIYVNGVLRDYLQIKHRDTKTFTFEPGELKGGVNEFKIEAVNPTASNYGPDYFRLTPIKGWHDPALLLLIR